MTEQATKSFQSGREILSHYVPGYKDVLSRETAAVSTLSMTSLSDDIQLCLDKMAASVNEIKDEIIERDG